MAETESAVKDMLRVEEAATAKMRESIKDLANEVREVLTMIKEDRKEMQEDRKEMHALKELQKDEIREYDRLSERMATELKATILIKDELKQLLA